MAKESHASTSENTAGLLAQLCSAEHQRQRRPCRPKVSAKGFGPVNLEKLEGSRSGEERLTTQAPIRIDCTQR